MNRRLLIVIALVCAVVAVWVYVRPMAASAVGLAARQACSLHIGAGIALPLARATYIDRHVRPIGPYIVVTIDQTATAAHASLLGVASATAVHRDGYGCVLDHGLALTTLTPYPLPEAEAGEINQPEKSARFDSGALDTVIADAFEEPSPSEPRQTMAVLVLSNGQLVAQKYATGISPDTPLPGFSMAKSMTATMIGLLVKHKNLDVMSVVPDAGQLTAAGATYDDLLRMVSGVGVAEDGSGRDGNSIMLTQRHDAAGYAVQQDLHAEPGEQYAYTGGNSVVLAQQFVNLAGDGDPSKAYAFLAEQLLKPLQLNSVVLETDGVGTFLGSSFMLASALDWAKLGQLYLQNGVWEGQRVLPADWVKYVSTKTPQSEARDYGAGFWVAVDGGRDSQHGHLPRPPEDALFMHGMMNQAVYILPTQSLVVVRLGATRSYLASGEWELLAGVLGALRAAPDGN